MKKIVTKEVIPAYEIICDLDKREELEKQIKELEGTKE